MAKRRRRRRILQGAEDTFIPIEGQPGRRYNPRTGETATSEALLYGPLESAQAYPRAPLSAEQQAAFQNAFAPAIDAQIARQVPEPNAAPLSPADYIPVPNDPGLLYHRETGQIVGVRDVVQPVPAQAVDRFMALFQPSPSEATEAPTSRFPPAVVTRQQSGKRAGSRQPRLSEDEAVSTLASLKEKGAVGIDGEPIAGFPTEDMTDEEKGFTTTCS